MGSENYDKRLTPARPDLAAEHLRGKVQAQRYAPGEACWIGAGIANVLPKPDALAGLDTQAIFGEPFTVYERKGQWVWGQLARDGYVGFVQDTFVETGVMSPAYRVCALRAPVFARADLKSAHLGYLPLNAAISVASEEADYVELKSGGWLSRKHVSDFGSAEPDWVAVAERILGAPYLWGGKTPDGLDCSGLIQTAMHAAGLECPRDTDMQERALGSALAEGTKLQRGDVVFWKGHVGVMRNDTELLHANAHHMCTAIEPLAEAITRIAAKGTQISSIRRLNANVA
jgi:hypothetical protein